MTIPRKTPAMGLSIAVTAFMLSGCQALGIGQNKLARASADPAVVAQPIDLGAEQLAAGREALAAGRTMDAIEAFMLAKAFPEQMPAAYNGLAVAFSRLGRTDLTERYFLTAVALAPDQDRYRANLAMFYSRNGPPKQAEPALAVAPQPTVAEAPATVAATVAPVRALAGGLTIQSPGTHLQRISRAEVAIRSGGPAPAAARAVAPARRAVIEVGSARSQAYPVRVTLAAPKPARAETPKSYPVRVELND